MKKCGKNQMKAVLKSPELPNEVNQTSTVESAILSWLLIFLLIFLLCLQAKYYIPDAAMQCLIRFLSFFVYLADILL